MGHSDAAEVTPYRLRRRDARAGFGEEQALPSPWVASGVPAATDSSHASIWKAADVITCASSS